MSERFADNQGFRLNFWDEGSKVLEFRVSVFMGFGFKIHGPRVQCVTGFKLGFRHLSGHSEGLMKLRCKEVSVNGFRI